MHNIKEYIAKIVDDGDRKEMEELSNLLDEVIKDIKNYDEEKYDKYKMCLYKMAYGNILSRDMAQEIIENMKPYRMRWSLEESRDIQQQYGMDYIRDIDFWVVLNSAYNDYRDVFGDNLELYVKYTRNFIEDEDAKDGKVFRYFTTIVK